MALYDILFSEEFIFEGEQAEEYRKRKEEERSKKAQKDKDDIRKTNQYGHNKEMQGYNHTMAKHGYKKDFLDDDDEIVKTQNKTQRQTNNRANKGIEMTKRELANRSKKGNTPDLYTARQIANAAIKRTGKNKYAKRNESAELYDGAIDLV